jgi:hypothetical protein
VLKPINTRNQYEADSDNLSSRSSVISADTGHHRYPPSGGNSQYKPSYPPSRASADDIELYPRTPSSFQSNSRTPTPLAEHHPSKHFNPIYQTSANRSPFSVRASVNEAATPGGPTPHHKQKDLCGHLFTGIRKQAGSCPLRQTRDPALAQAALTFCTPGSLYSLADL